MFLPRRLPLFFVCLWIFSLSHAHAAAPAGEEWWTIQSPHFRVHHTKPLEAYARAFTKALERSLPLLERDLKWTAPKEIDVVIMDPSDSANGFAVNFPNTHMGIYAVPFEADSILAYYFDWVDELATHELTHIIANDTTLGYYTTLRKIFGSWVKPNGLQPSWLIEGLAVYEETALSPAGRGRSPLLEAMLKTAAQAGKLNNPDYISLDRFNDGVPWWPGGNTPYLLGYTAQAMAQGNHPAHIPGEVSHANAKRFPYMPDTNVEKIVGKDWSAIWSEAAQKLEMRYPSTNTPTPCQLTQSGKFTGGHALSPDGWIYFSEEDKDHGYFLARVRADADCSKENPPQIERLYRKYFEGPTQVSVSPDGKKVAFIEMDRVGLEYLFNDLYLWEAETGGVEHLTSGGRTRSPAFADANNLLYVQSKEDTSQVIMRRNLLTKEEHELFHAQPMERISGLHARDNRAAFALHNNKGNERIYLLHTTTGKAAPMEEAASTAKLSFERNPFIATNGKIYFSGSYNHGPLEIYAFDLQTKKREKVVSLASGYVDRPVLLPDGKTLLVQNYDLSGLNLVRVPLGTLEASTKPTQDLHEFFTGKKEEIAQDVGELPPSQPYSVWSSPATSLWPQYWLPLLSWAEDGALLGATTSGNDPLQYHSYALSAQYDTRASFPIYNAFYHNRVFSTEFHIEANQYNNYFRGSKTSNRSSTYSGSIMVPFFEAQFSLGGAFQEKDLFGLKAQSYLIFQNFRYEKLAKTPFALSTNEGQIFEVYAAAFPGPKNENAFFDLRPRMELYTRGIYPTHSVAFSALAGITTNKLLVSNYYVGGGVSNLDPSAYVVRGYPVDTLFGQRIATANLSYSLPLAHPFRGWNTNPLFFSRWGLRFMADVGSANYIARYNGEKFLRYQASGLGKRLLYGFGIDMISTGSVLYHVPITMNLGLHYGPQKKYGGELGVFWGLNIGSFGSYGTKPSINTHQSHD